jgi:rSAM/selenodomain-associated transferase 1
MTLTAPAMDRVVEPGAQWSAASQRTAFVVMAKAPLVGSVKTRLIPPLTAEEAAELSRCFIRDMAVGISSIADVEAGIGIVAFTPPDQANAFDDLLPAGFHLLAQRGSDLGERLLHATQDLLAAGFASVCLINGDSPTLPPSCLAQAASLLRQSGDRVALGPAEDGGYYLIGLKRPHARMFDRIDWSTPRVFEQSLARAAEIGLEVARLQFWYDVDDAASLQRLLREVAPSRHEQKDHPSGSGNAPRTAAYLRQIAENNPAVRALFAGHMADACPD